MSKPLNKMTVKALKALCKEMKIKKYSKCKKAVLIKMIQDNQPKSIVKEPTPVPVVVEEIKEPTPKPVSPPLPANLDTDISGFEEFIPKEEQKEDEVMSDLDEFIENYDEEKMREEQLKKEEENQRKCDEERKQEKLRLYEEQKQRREEEELKRMKKELLEKLKEEEKPKPKPIKKIVKKPIKKSIPKPLDLSTVSLEDLMAEAKKRGYVMNKYVAPKIITTYQEKILANTIDDLDLLSDDEESDDEE